MTPSRAHNPMLRVFSLPDFRLLFAGATTSLLGDQFALIATPWLVLRLTGDPLVLGAVLALEGIPRALFMLLGGAITDRLSPRLVMLCSDLVRLLLTAAMAFVVLTGTVQLWMLYAFGLGFGLVAGFAIPASTSIVPMLVGSQDLQAGNAITMGAMQLTGFVGPTVAGILIGRYASSDLGIGLAYTIDAASFAVSAACLVLMHGGGRLAASPKAASRPDVGSAIVVGLRFLWQDRGLRLLFLLMAAMNLLFTGPLLVGIPVLANQRLPEGATAFGLLMSAFAGGNLIGYLLAGALPRPTGAVMRRFLVVLLAAFALVLGSYGFIRSTWVDFGLTLLLGVGNGYLAILLMTWIQTRTPQEMLGRMMSIVMLSSTGLLPISQAVAGAVAKGSLTLLFALAGALGLLLTLWAGLQPGLKAFSDSLSALPS
ncbi:MAG TPA: MFS transporter [Anaerolineae bacterium]